MYAVRQACLAQAINQHLSDWVTPVVTPGGFKCPAGCMKVLTNNRPLTPRGGPG
ncbi:GntR-family regulatory protein [Salmonella enterica subsp. enterica serovar Enteritidis str. 543463 42-20]|nr:GntR-family regulatory protein [Salmonella enterica subsp. enterica serovar Enteritidis str. 543463 42-20]